MATGLRLEAIVLAAGQGARFGGGKLLAAYAGRPVLHGALAAAFAAPVRAVTLVTGADAEVVGATGRAFEPRVRLVHAADPAEGIGASIRAGIAALPADTTGVFVFLGDMPRVPQAVLAPMAQALADDRLAAAPQFGGRRGHPVAFARGLFPVLMTLSGDAGAREILHGLDESLALIDAPDDGVLFDVDLPSDLSLG